VLEIRDRLDAEARALYEKRSALLRDLLLSSNPESLARRRFPEIDQVFLSVLSSALREAEEKGDEQGAKALQALWNLVLRLMEETLPPEVRLFNRLMAAEDGAQVDKLLQENSALVTERFVRFVEGAEPNVHRTGPPEAADRLALVLEKARAMLLQAKPA
jgi:hypothetical protein